jgi:hypothetical protein
MYCHDDGDASCFRYSDNVMNDAVRGSGIQPCCWFIQKEQTLEKFRLIDSTTTTTPTPAPTTTTTTTTTATTTSSTTTNTNTATN